MSLIHWHPLKELDNLRRQMNSLFDEVMHRNRLSSNTEFERWSGFNLLSDPSDLSWSPAIDFKETEQELILKVELPGIEAKDVDIQVSDTLISIAGERKEEKHHKEKGGYWAELSYGQFQRIVPLPMAIDKNNVKADLKNGLLTLHLPKSQSAIANTVKVDLVESQARKAMVEQRQHQQHQQETMQARAMEELTEPKDNGGSVKEEARKIMVEERQHKKHQQETMQARATDEVS
jgi:HSP20 family protein